MNNLNYAGCDVSGLKSLAGDWVFSSVILDSNKKIEGLLQF